MRLNSDDDTFNPTVIAQQSIRISNDLYGNDVCSSYELVKGFTRPIEAGKFPNIFPEDLLKARETISAKRKLKLIPRSKSTTNLPINVGDLVQVFIKLQHENRGKWSSPKPVLSYDKSSGIVTVPGQNGRKIRTSVQDVRFAVTNDELAIQYQEAMDALDLALNDSVEPISGKVPD